MKYKKGQLVRVQYLNSGTEMERPTFAYISRTNKEGFWYKSFKKPVYVPYDRIDKQNEYNTTIKVDICSTEP